ncbi:acyl-CoA N-acyltransferase [Karstenula rhodostoma CBS 690.94]|uniref:Acyl-CoA N-acyltransferase n=1 Tax=Karstenula rhodostoma CBS 690.94 TaxID=1392251 RepID=A0A9P4U6P1_9PLEO|nr:acyl-CoA N-acyltransferase [Karstenula rhodostoma CBS 690.94]
MTITPATHADAPSIAAIGSATFTTSFAHSMPEKDLQAYLLTSYAPSVIHAELSDTRENSFYVACLADGAVAGFLQVKHRTSDPCLPPELKLVEIHRVYVATEHHGRGIGGKLLEHALEVVRRDGESQGAWLGVWEENLRAQKFYAGFGFAEKVGRHAFTMGECVQWDEIVLFRF